MNKKDSEVDTVLSRMKQIFNVQRDADLSRAMGISPQTLSSWRQRSAIPYVLCVECAESKGASLDWLLYGVGSMMRDTNQEYIESDSNKSKENVSTRQQINALLADLPLNDLEDILNEAANRQRLRSLEQKFDKLQTQFFGTQKK